MNSKFLNQQVYVLQWYANTHQAKNPSIQEALRYHIKLVLNQLKYYHFFHQVIHFHIEQVYNSGLVGMKVFKPGQVNHSQLLFVH